MSFNHHSKNSSASMLTGSMRELWTLSFPLMLSLMSSSLMFFWDRLLLAQFSMDAHNAATSAGTWVTFLQFAFLCTTCIGEVFVGQYNGAGEEKKIGKPVWQMIWLSLSTILIFIPLGIFAGDALFASSPYALLEIDYFRYMMCFGPIFCLSSALSTFYIGRGCVKFVTATVILANVLNTVLAYFFIFGVESYFPPMGIAGAALATGISQLIQTLILFIDFIRPKYRQRFGTGNFHFDWNEFMKCVRLGFPSSLAHTIEILAWALFFRMLMSAGEEQFTVVSVAQSIFFLFTFLTEGISKGATVIAANLIGAGRGDGLWKLLYSGAKFYALIFVLFGALFLIHPTPLIDLFFTEENAASGETYALIVSSCLWVWVFFLFDGIHWLVVGLLTAAGDTKFVLKAGSFSVWIFALLPTYVFVVLYGHTPDMAWAITAFYGLAICSIYLARFYGMRWKGNLAIA